MRKILKSAYSDFTDQFYMASDWQPNLTHDDDHLLVQSGRDEMKQLGQRFKARFPTLFDKFDPQEIVVRKAIKSFGFFLHNIYIF